MHVLLRRCFGVLFCAATAAAAPIAPTPLPSGPSLLNGDSLSSFELHTAPSASAAARFETVAANGPGFSKAWRVSTLQDTSPSDAIELRALNHLPVSEGDVGMLRFFARATAAGDETGTGRVMIVIRRNGIDSNSSYEGDFSIGREWQEILIPFTFAKDFPVDGAAIMLRFGFKRQTLEIGGLDVLFYGKSQDYATLPRTSFSYVGREPDAAWRKAALARIEQVRKSDFFVHVKDANGKPVAGVKIQAKETNSAFEWGSALQMARLVQDSPDNRIYRQKVLELFNAASTENDLKWPAWIGEWEGSYSKEQTLAGLHWIRDHGLDARGHVLVWPGKKNLPEPITSRLGTPQQNEIPGLVEAHIREMAKATTGLVTEWDVLNEPYTNHDLMDTFGPEIMPTWFKVARAAMHNTRLFFNDFSNHDATTDADHVAHFEKTVRFLLDHGAPVTGLGIQAHFGGRPNAPENILKVFDEYQQKFHLPLRITEFDVWTYDEPLQADFTRDFLILCYSHPDVIGVQFWGFWSKAHWRPVSGMFRDDWSERPIAQVYRDLVLHQWRTQTGGTTDASGHCQLRGFQGTYTVSAEVNGRTIEQTFILPAGGQTADVMVTLP